MKLDFLQRFKRRSPDNRFGLPKSKEYNAKNMSKIKPGDFTGIPTKLWAVDLTGEANGNGLTIQKALVTGFAQQKADNANKVLDYLYVVEVLWHNRRHSVVKRSFTDFYNFHISLVHEFRMLPKEENPMQLTRFLPAWKSKKENTIALAETRELQLNRYVQQLLSLPTKITNSSTTLTFFESRVTDPKPFKFEPEEGDEDYLTSQSDYVSCWI